MHSWQKAAAHARRILRKGAPYGMSNGEHLLHLFVSSEVWEPTELASALWLQVLKKWVSRFDLWPYVEQYTLDVQREILAEMGQKPDLIVGNYSDGNLVASLLAHRMFVTQCNIAHAIEKTKYQDADIKW
jgi:hypothetical protein